MGVEGELILLKQKQEILLMYLREGRSQREISRMTGVDRKTIRKYIKEYEFKREELERNNVVEDPAELIQAIVETPKYKVGDRPKRKLTDDIIQKIQEHIYENEEKRRKGLRKQLKKPIDIYEALTIEGIDISYSTVLRMIRSMEKKAKEAFIKGQYRPGDICEFDWGEAKLIIGDKPRIIQIAVFTSAYGNFRFSYLFTKQATECFQEAHARFFEKIGGVYHTMVYDNMKVAVKRFVGTEKEPTEGLLKLSLYYTFQFRFCNVARGNEKGHVERSVEVIRRKAFAFRDTFETLEEANQYLQEVCDKLNQKPQSVNKEQTGQALFEQEQHYLLPHLPMFDAARIQNLRVDKYSTVVIDQSHYSVPDYLVGERIMVKIYSNRIQCFHLETKVAEHHRLTGCHEWSLQIEHYINTLKKKPGALAGSAALQQASKRIQNIYQTYYISREKEFIELIQYMNDGVELKEIERSITELSKIHPNHVTTDKIKILCAKYRETPTIPVPVSQDTKEIADYARHHLKMYDELFQTHSIDSKEEIA